MYSEKVYLTVDGVDGFGAGYHAILGAVAWCTHNGYVFVHTPVHLRNPSGNQNLSFYGIGRDKELDDFMGFKSDEDYDGEFEIQSIDESSKGRPGICTKKLFIKEVALAKRPSIYYTPEVLDKIRKMYYSTGKPSSGEHDIAIHIRRGDVNENMDIEGKRARYTSDDFYVQLIKFLQENYPSYSICVYSEGEINDFKKLKNLDINFCLNGDIKKTFHDFVTAKILVTSKSSFSYVAAILSEGIVYYIPMNEKPLDHWNEARE